MSQKNLRDERAKITGLEAREQKLEDDLERQKGKNSMGQKREHAIGVELRGEREIVKICEARVGELELHLAEEMRKNSSLENRVRVLEGTLGEEGGRRGRLEERVRELEASVREGLEGVEELGGRRAILEKRVSELEGLLEGERSKLKRIQEEEMLRSVDLQGSEKIIFEKNKVLAGQEIFILELQQREKEMREQISTSQERSIGLQKLIAELQQGEKDLRAQTAVLQEHSSGLEKLLSEKDKTLSERAATIDDQGAVVADLRSREDAMLEQIEKLQSTLTETGEFLGDMQSQVEQLEREVEEKDNVLMGFQSREGALKEHAEMVERELAEKEEIVLGFKSREETLRSALREAEDLLRRLTLELEQSRELSVSLEQQVAELRGAVDLLRGEGGVWEDEVGKTALLLQEARDALRSAEKAASDYEDKAMRVGRSLELAKAVGLLA